MMLFIAFNQLTRQHAITIMTSAVLLFQCIANIIYGASMKRLLVLIGVALFVGLGLSACGKDQASTNKTLLSEMSGVWLAKGDNSMVTFDTSDKKTRLLINDMFIPVTVGAIDDENGTANLNVTLKDGKPGIWTLRQVWDNQEKTSFHLTVTFHDGTHDDLSFVRKVSTDDLNRIASLEAAANKPEQLKPDVATVPPATEEKSDAAAPQVQPTALQAGDQQQGDEQPASAAQ